MPNIMAVVPREKVSGTFPQRRWAERGLFGAMRRTEVREPRGEPCGTCHCVLQDKGMNIPMVRCLPPTRRMQPSVESGKGTGRYRTVCHGSRGARRCDSGPGSGQRPRVAGGFHILKGGSS